MDWARFLCRYEGVFFIGRGTNSPVALSVAFKLNGISHIHAEGYTAGELRHDHFALLCADTPVSAIVANDSTCSATLTNSKDVEG